MGIDKKSGHCKYMLDMVLNVYMCFYMHACYIWTVLEMEALLH